MPINKQKNIEMRTIKAIKVDITGNQKILCDLLADELIKQKKYRANELMAQSSRWNFSASCESYIMGKKGLERLDTLFDKVNEEMLDNLLKFLQDEIAQYQQERSVLLVFKLQSFFIEHLLHKSEELNAQIELRTQVSGEGIIPTLKDIVDDFYRECVTALAEANSINKVPAQRP